MMCCKELFFCLFILSYVLCSTEAVPRSYIDDGASGPIVETKVGRIRGLQADDGEYSMFMGIPYAQHDTDNFFGPALPYPPFENTFDAFDDSSICPQVEEFNHTIVGTVDCMNLNVYVPHNASAENKLPVFVWIFGGGFTIGFAGRFLYGPRFMVRHDVIMVTFNYRLGPYGFMCLDTPEVPGNQGLKDQLMALRWIKENIGAFGGDDTKITIAGNSAGAMSVDLHLYYGKEDLFNKIIPQSGVSLVAVNSNNNDPTVPLKLAEYFNYTPNDLSDALSFLATVESDQLIAASQELELSFGACLEKEFEDVENFITQRPINMDVPRVKNIEVLIGFTNDELYTGYADRPDIYFDQMDFVGTRINQMFDFQNDEELYTDMYKIVTNFYFGDQDVNAELMQEITDMGSDFLMVHPVIRTMKKYLENGVQSMYLYLFSYAGGRNFAKHRVQLEGGGAAHADELGYLFDISYMEKPLDPADQLIVDRMTLLWANFVKYGNPTPELTELVPVHWPAVTQDKWHYLELDTEIRVSTRPFHARMAFLDLFFKANEQFQRGLEKNEEEQEIDPEPSAGRNIVLELSLPLLFAIRCFLYSIW